MVDVEALLLTWFRNRPENTGVTFGTLRPADLSARLPYVLVTRIGGGADPPSWRGGVLLDRAGVNLQTWATPNRANCRTLICSLIGQLATARGVALAPGVIVRVGVLAGPTALPDPDSGDQVHRFTATVQVTAR